MKKITDRFLLGVISGLGGNIAKTVVEMSFTKIGYKETAVKKAAGIFLKKNQVSSKKGKAIGYITDNMIAAGLGITCVYWLTLTGKDFKVLKGAGLGAAEWASIYGVLSKLGATNIYPTPAFDALVAFLSHLVFGATKISIAGLLGDDRLFHPGNLTMAIQKPQELSLFTDEKKLDGLATIRNRGNSHKRSF